MSDLNTSRTLNAGRWLYNQPYLLLSLTSLFWAGNIVLGRFVAGQVPPMTLSCIRWSGSFILLLPFAWPYLKRDWPMLKSRLPMMVVLSATGFAANNTLSYAGLQYTEALNALLIQSSGPLFVAMWALVLFGVRLTIGQTLGITLSLIGVLIIILRGDITALTSIEFNIGDLMFASALLVFGLYSALMPKRPAVHLLSLITFTTGCGALLLLPFLLWEVSTGYTLKPNLLTAATLVYVVIFPSLLAYLFFNRGIALIGPNRAAPYFHLVPVFGSVMAIALLGEKLRLFHIIGYVLVLGGIALASRKASARPAAK